EYPAKIHVRSKLHYFVLIKDRLNEVRRLLFRTTCFGPWLDITYVENDDGMIHYVLQKQCCADDDSFDLSLIYNVNGRNLHFEWNDVKIIDVLALIEDEEKFSKVSDEDAIRLYLLLSLEIIESSCESNRWWAKVPEVIPQAVAWTRKAEFFTLEYFRELFYKAPIELAPTKAEFQSNWYTPSYDFLCGMHRGAHLFPSEGCVKGREAALIDRIRYLEGLCESLLTLLKEVKSLRGRIFKLESIIQVITLKTNRVEKNESLNKICPQIENLLKSTSEDKPDIINNTF
nr:phospholipase-like protein [Tanacetum cinerariifolium]